MHYQMKIYGECSFSMNRSILLYHKMILDKAKRNVDLVLVTLTGDMTGLIILSKVMTNEKNFSSFGRIIFSSYFLW